MPLFYCRGPFNAKIRIEVRLTDTIELHSDADGKGDGDGFAETQSKKTASKKIFSIKVRDRERKKKRKYSYLEQTMHRQAQRLSRMRQVWSVPIHQRAPEYYLLLLRLEVRRLRSFEMTIIPSTADRLQTHRQTRETISRMRQDPSSLQL